MLRRIGLRRARCPTADACGQLLARARIAHQHFSFHTGWHLNGMAGPALLQPQPQGSKRQGGGSCPGAPIMSHVLRGWHAFYGVESINASLNNTFTTDRIFV